MENAPNFGSGPNSRFEAPSDSLDETKDKEKSKSKSKARAKSTAWTKPASKADKPKPEPGALFEAKPNDRLEAKSKPEPPLEKLSTDEKQAVAKDYVKQRGDDVKSELETPSRPEEEAASLANAALLDRVNERLDAGAVPDPELLDGALAETAESLGLDPEALDGSAEPGAEPAETPETPESPDAAATPEATDSEDDENDDPNNPLGGSQPGSPSSNSNNSNGSNRSGPGAGGGNGGAGNNGHGPGGFGPGGPVFGGGGPGGPGGGGNRPMGPNILPMPVALNPNNLPLPWPERRHGHAKYVLAGGIVGYLLGRRRGRINTEKKLLPVQHKLEQEVSGLHQQIAERETKIRRLAREQAAQQPGLNEQIIRRLENRRQTAEATLQPPEKAAVAEKAPLLNADQTERLGQVALQPEKPVEVVNQQVAERIAGQVLGRHEADPVLRVETAPLEQVLKLAEDIKIEQQDLRQLYQAGRVEQKDLRKVIEAYVKGERYDRLLSESLKPLTSQELLTKTAAGLRQQAGNSGGDSSSPHLESLVRRAAQPNQLQIERAEELLRRPAESSQSTGLKALPLILVTAILLIIVWLILK